MCLCFTECSCRQGSPCTCGYSPSQCSQHCTGQQNNAYVLPVRYSNGDSYVVYDYPQKNAQLQRRVRQVDGMGPVGPMPMGPMPMQMNSNSPMPMDPMAAFSSIADRIRSASSAIRERMSSLGGGNSDSSLGSTLGSTLGSALGSTSGSSRSPSIDVDAIKERFTSLASPIMTHTTKIIEGFKDIASSVRSKRDVNDKEAWNREIGIRMPMLRVKEHDASSGSNRYTKYLNSRVELKTPDTQEKVLKEMEKATRCNSCGSKLTSSKCSKCGAYQPQYVEYVEGKPVSFYPGAVEEKKMDDEKSDEVKMPRHIYDRYGHRYLENNGNLRLIAPQYQESVIGDQPDFAGLANILNDNREIMQEMNRNGDRMMPEPVKLVTDFTKLIRDMAQVRDADDSRANHNEKRSTDAAEKRPMETKNEKIKPRTMYQLLPMQYDNQDGKLVVRVYDDKTKTETNSEEAKNKDEQKTKQNVDTTASIRSQPIARKFTNNENVYEVLSFDDKTSSDEDIRRIIEHLHSQQSW